MTIFNNLVQSVSDCSFTMDKKTRTNKTVKKGKRAKKSKEDDVNTARKVEEAKLGMYSEIMDKTGLSEDDVTQAHTGFQNDYPSGTITKDQFMGQSGLGFLSEPLFKSFDKENKGEIDFLTFMFASSVTLSSPEEKLDWIFTAFDKDGGGTIDTEEIREIVLELFRMAEIEEEEDLVVACVADIKKSVDADDDGEITKEEFVKNALKSRFLKHIFKN